MQSSKIRRIFISDNNLKEKIGPREIVGMSGLIENPAFLHIVISLGILLFTAKIFAEIFHRLKLPVVLGELLAGIVVGPFALGTFLHFDGKPIVVLDETIKHIGELSAIVILFIAGLEITPRES